MFDVPCIARPCLREGRAMQHSISYQTPERPAPTEHAPTRLRTVSGNRFPRKCACGCGFQIPRDPEVRYVVDFGAQRPYPAYLREHSTDYGSYHGQPRTPENVDPLPGFVRGSDLPRPVRSRPREGSQGGASVEMTRVVRGEPHSE
jgi:hypothetical protein